MCYAYDALEPLGWIRCIFLMLLVLRCQSLHEYALHAKDIVKLVEIVRLDGSSQMANGHIV